MNICIVIPVHNEAKEIGNIVAVIKAKGLDVLVIDDGSVDKSGEIARANGAFVVSNEQRKGKGFSLQKAFVYALEKGYQGVITMDGDGQHTVTDLDFFIEKIQQFPEQVFTGNRMHDPKGMPPVRLLTNRFMSWLISAMCRQRISDTQCGYRYISQDVLKNLQLTSTDFEIETEVLVQASRMGCKIVSIPIQTIYRDERSKIHPYKDTVRFLRYLLKSGRPPKAT